MKPLVLTLGLAAGLLGFGSGTASAQYYGPGPSHYNHHHHGGGYGGGYGGYGGYRPYGGGYYGPGSSFYYGGPPVAVVRPAPYPVVGTPAFGYPGLGYPAYTPGVSFGLTIVR